jgi:anti-sigma factor RsiW
MCGATKSTNQAGGIVNTPPTLSAAADQRLNDLLPWYINGTLEPDQRAWIDQMIATHPAANAALEREKNLSMACATMLVPVVAQDVGLARLRSRIKADAANAPTPSVGSRQSSFLTSVLQWLTKPQFAAAMGVLVVAQAGSIAWLVSAPDHSEGISHTRSVGVVQVHTLRVSFRAGASEAEIRTALVGAAARIVGGPTQIGEYWVASDLTSLDEIRAALLKSNVVVSIEVDLAGPRGQ